MFGWFGKSLARFRPAAAAGVPVASSAAPRVDGSPLVPVPRSFATAEPSRVEWCRSAVGASTAQKLAASVSLAPCASMAPTRPLGAGSRFAVKSAAVECVPAVPASARSRAPHHGQGLAPPCVLAPAAPLAPRLLQAAKIRMEAVPLAKAQAATLLPNTDQAKPPGPQTPAVASAGGKAGFGLAPLAPRSFLGPLAPLAAISPLAPLAPLTCMPRRNSPVATAGPV